MDGFSSSASTRLSSPRRLSLARVPLAALAAVALLLSACAPGPEEKLAAVREMQEQGRLDESIELLREMIGEGSREGEVMYRYARALSLTGKAGRGIWALDEALEDPEWFVRASHQVAFDAYRVGNHDLALAALERLKNERTDSHQEDLAARLLEVRVRAESRRMYEEALELVEEILDEHPDQDEAIRLKAVCLIGLKETDEAYELIRDADLLAADVGVGVGVEAAGLEGAEDGEDELALGPTLEEVYWCTVRATFKREAGELEEAREIADDCLERLPSNQRLLSEAVQIYGKLGDFDRIDEVMKKAHEDAPDSSELRIAWVRHLETTNRKEEAEAVLRKSVSDAQARESAPSPHVDLAKRWVELGGFLVENERHEEGLEAYGEALEILGDLASPGLLFRHAEGLILAERYDEALAIADRTPIEVHPPMIRGRVAFERGEYEEAIEQLSGAALSWPDNAPIRYYLARSYEGVGDFDRAIEEYRQAVRADPSLSASHERLARLHLAEGQVREAATILEFISPKKASKPSSQMRILQIEAQARLGREPDLTIPESTDLTLGELRRGATFALMRGLRERAGAEAAERVLDELQNQVTDASSRGYFVRARVELLLGMKEAGRAVAIARAAAAEPYATTDVGLGLARALVAEGESLDEAEKLLLRVLDRLPEEPEALTALGDLARLRGQPDEATPFYERALEATPDHWPALAALLGDPAAAGRNDDALRRLEDYVDRHNPYDGNAALRLSRALDAAKREERVALAERAIRFGAGEKGLAWLTELDPEAASQYDVIAAPSAETATEDTAPAPNAAPASKGA